MLQSLSLCACVCHMNEPLEKSQNTDRRSYGTQAPLPTQSSPKPCRLKQKGHKCVRPVKPGNTDTSGGSKVNRRLTLHSPANESKAVS